MKYFTCKKEKFDSKDDEIAKDHAFFNCNIIKISPKKHQNNE